jgi:hypothetical protein
MADEYQRGSENEWLKHSNDELAHLVKKRDRQLQRARSFSVLLLLALGWVLFRYRQQLPLESLWRF